MRRFYCDGFKSVMAEDISEAAKVFATRLARRNKLEVYTVNQRSSGMSSATYQATIGRYDKKQRVFVVDREEYLQVSITRD